MADCDEAPKSSDPIPSNSQHALANQVAQLNALEQELNALIARSGLNPTDFDNDAEEQVEEPGGIMRDEEATEMIARLRLELEQVESELETPKKTSPSWLPPLEDECRLSDEEGEDEEDDESFDGEEKEFEQLLMENLRLRQQLDMLQKMVASADRTEEEEEEEEEEEKEDEDEEMDNLEAKVQRQQSQLLALREKLAGMCSDIKQMKEMTEGDDDEQDGDAGPEPEMNTLHSGNANDDDEDDADDDDDDINTENPIQALAEALARLNQLEMDAKRLQNENAVLEENLGELKAKEALLQRLMNVDMHAEELEWERWLQKIADPAYAAASKAVVFVDGTHRKPPPIIDFDLLQSTLGLPSLANPDKDLIALYAYGVHNDVQKDTIVSHWYSRFLPEAEGLNVHIIADMLELFIRFGGNLQYFFIGAGGGDYIPLFQKALRYGATSLTLYCNANEGVTLQQAQAHALGVAVEYMGDIFQ